MKILTKIKILKKKMKILEQKKNENFGTKKMKILNKKNFN